MTPTRVILHADPTKLCDNYASMRFMPGRSSAVPPVVACMSGLKTARNRETQREREERTNGMIQKDRGIETERKTYNEKDTSPP